MELKKLFDLKKITEIFKRLYLILFGSGKEAFFAKLEFRGDAVTYDDIRLKTGHAKVMPKDVDLKTKFSKNVPLNIPIVSAAMDTITTAKLAIEMAKLGGLGIIHKAMTIKKQASEVARVKLNLHGKISIKDLITINPEQTMQDVLDMIKKKEYGFNNFPVVTDGLLVGVITGSSFTFCDDNCRMVKDIMQKEIITATKNTTPEQAYEKMRKNHIKFLPLVYGKQKKLVGLYTFKDVERIVKSNPDMYNVDDNGQLIVGAAVGTGDEEKERVKALVAKNVDVIVIDTAHGDSKPVFDMLVYIKKNYNVDVVVGNVSEPASAESLIELGADGIKGGQGGGSICTTRIIAGIGVPQATMTYKCAQVCKKHGVPFNSDGAIKYSGDITLAIGLDADSVMVGNVLAGTDETPGDVILIDGKQWKIYRGMGSIDAMVENPGAAQRYHQDEKDISQMIAEGIVSRVPYKGPLANVIYQLIGGLRAGMGYVGAANIRELQKKADFYRISSLGQVESHPHDVTITKEAPNYQN